MPIHKIEVSEYECIHCGYKWINRVNGKDKPIPQRCAKCKRFYWNDGQYVGRNTNPITNEERGLRMRLYKFEASKAPGYFTHPKAPGLVFHKSQYDPNELCKKFLGLKPRPTMQELIKALHPLGWDIQKHKNFVPNPDKEGWLKYNPQEYQKLLEQETLKRREYMQQVIESRNPVMPEII